MLRKRYPMLTSQAVISAPTRRFWGGVAVTATVCALLAPSLPAQAVGGPADATVSSTEQAPQAMTQERIDAANDAYNGVDAKLEFLTMSDTELGGTATADKTAEQVAYEGILPHFNRLSEWAKAKDFSVEAVINNGDVVGANDPEYNDHLKGNSEKTAGWYRAVERVMSESFPEAQVLLTQGNHDIADLMGKTFEEARAGKSPEWFYPNADTEYVSNFHATIGGIDFIGLDYNGKHTYGYGGQHTGYQQFLKDTLQSISSAPDYDPAKPIFVSIHSGYGGTSLGGPFHGVYDMAGPDLQKILSDYPQAMLGSAHTHFSSNPETSIFQKDFTVYENASMNYIYQDVPGDFIGGGYFDGNQGDPEGGIGQTKSANFVTVLDTGETVIRRYDVTQNRWMGMPWVVDTSNGKDGFTYTNDQRSKVAPWWQASSIVPSKVTETAVTLGFDHASDDELVNYYEVEITDSNGSPVPFTANQMPDFGNTKPKSFTGSFKAYSRFYMKPNTMSFNIDGLKAAKTYQVKVYAFDDFQNKSKALEGSFRTAGTSVLPEFPETETPAPTGEFLNLAFEGDLSDTGAAASSAPAPAPVGAVEYVDTDRTGASGQAVRIGGGSANYVDLGSRPEFDLGTDKDLTISFWTKVTAVNGYGSFISNKNWANWYRSGINLAPEGSNTGKLEFTVGDGTNGVYASGDVTNYRGSWHQMAVTVDRARNMASTFMDGTLVKETSLNGVGSLTSGLNMLVGVDGGKSYGAGFDMDDLRMWDSALSEAELASLFAADDSSAAIAAVSGAVEYANEVIAANEVAAANGRVFDQALTAALTAAVAGAEGALAQAPVSKSALRDAHVALKAAAAEVEAQPVRYAYAATAVNGTVTPADGVADAQGELRLKLAPDTGFQIDDAAILVSGAESHAVVGDELVIQNAQQRLAVSVEFAALVDEGGAGGTANGTANGGSNTGADGTAGSAADGGANGTPGTSNSGTGGSSTASGSAQGTASGATGAAQGATGAGTADPQAPGLANTGGQSAVGWLVAGAVSLVLGAGALLTGRRMRARRASAE